VKVRLAYGMKGLVAEIPDHNLAKVLTMPDARPVKNTEADAAYALEHPIGSPPLSTLAAKSRSACVVICDVTRPVPNALLLPPILETLERCGIAPENVTILIATGLHRPTTTEEREFLVGPRITRSYRVIDHAARRLEDQKFLGSTCNRTPVYIDKAYCEADLKITTGFIEPHLMAGFSGGPKLIAPGCAGELTIKALHSPFFLEHPECREGSIDGNPLHHELLEIERMAGHDFLVNVSLNAGRAVTAIFAGGPRQAHAAGIAFVRTAVEVSVDKPVDIVVTTSAGFPLDLTFYQAIKGITAALPVVKEGGMIIIAAECAEGLGGSEFTEMATRFSDPESFVRAIAGRPVKVDQWQLEECAKAARKAVIELICPFVARKYAGRLFVKSATSVEAALHDGFRRFGPHATVAVIPDGPYVLARVHSPAAT
jgi:lactate racemase